MESFESNKRTHKWHKTPQYNFRKVTTDLEDYAMQKLRMLVMEFMVTPTEEELTRLFSAQNEIQVDNYIRWMFNRSAAI